MTLDALAHGAYAAALDETRWADWTRAMARAFGGSFGALNIVGSDLALPPMHRRIFTAEPEVLDRFVAAGVAPLDPQYLLLRRLGRATSIYRSGDHVDLRNPGTREFQGWMRSNARVEHHMTAWFAAGGDHHFALSIHRGVDDGSVDTAEVARFAALLPAMQGAATLAFAHAAKLATAYWDGAADASRQPAMLVDGAGRVLRVTAAAEAMLTRGYGLDVAGGRLRTGDHASAAALRRALAAAIARDGMAGSATIRVARPSGRAALVVTVHPLLRSNRLFSPFEAAALVTLVDPTPPPAPLPRSAEAFGLTPREAEVASLLLAGHSIESAAARLAIARETVRVHLRHLFGKTETARQSDLVRLLTRIG